MRGLKAAVIGALVACLPAATKAQDAAPEEAQPEVRSNDIQVIIVPTQIAGIDPVVADHVTARIRTTADELGYTEVDPEDSERALDRAGIQDPINPANLWQITYAAEAERGVAARVWSSGGRYVFEVIVASLDGTGPFVARTTSGAEDLHEVLGGLVRQLLPPPSSWRGLDVPAPPPTSNPPQRPQQTAPPSLLEQPDPFESRKRPPRPVGRRVDLALNTEGAFGLNDDFFYNHLAGARVGFRISSELIVSALASYANLRGKTARASNILPMAQLEHRVYLTRSSPLSLPLRVAGGYLPFNGPVFRLSAGINAALSENVEVGLDLVAPTFWFTPDETLLSLNVGAELILRL